MVALSFFLVLLVGTSKQLVKKDLTGKLLRASEGIQLSGTPTATFGESVNNQGMFADQMLDLEVIFTISNQTQTEVLVREKGIRIILDGESYKFKPGEVIVDKKKITIPLQEYRIASGGTQEITIFYEEFVSKEKLETTDKIEVVIPVAASYLHIIFEGVKEVGVTTR